MRNVTIALSSVVAVRRGGQQTRLRGHVGLAVLNGDADLFSTVSVRPGQNEFAALAGELPVIDPTPLRLAH